MEAIEKRTDWVYFTLTFQHRTKREKYQTYFKAGLSWDKLRKRLTYLYGNLQYVSSMERHEKGGCHCNFLVGNPDLAYAVGRGWNEWRNTILKPNAVACGFGFICWVKEVYGDKKKIAWYLTKLGNELQGKGKERQVPVDAPPHFRRIRASRGLLPKKPPKEFTGELVRCMLPSYNPDNRVNEQPCGCGGELSGEKKGEYDDSGERLVHAND